MSIVPLQQTSGLGEPLTRMAKFPHKRIHVEQHLQLTENRKKIWWGSFRNTDAHVNSMCYIRLCSQISYKSLEKFRQQSAILNVYSDIYILVDFNIWAGVFPGQKYCPVQEVIEEDDHHTTWRKEKVFSRVLEMLIDQLVTKGHSSGLGWLTLNIPKHSNAWHCVSG